MVWDFSIAFIVCIFPILHLIRDWFFRRVPFPGRPFPIPGPRHPDARTNCWCGHRGCSAFGSLAQTSGVVPLRPVVEIRLATFSSGASCCWGWSQQCRFVFLLNDLEAPPGRKLGCQKIFGKCLDGWVFGGTPKFLKKKNCGIACSLSKTNSRINTFLKKWGIKSAIQGVGKSGFDF